MGGDVVEDLGELGGGPEPQFGRSDLARSGFGRAFEAVLVSMSPASWASISALWINVVLEALRGKR